MNVGYVARSGEDSLPSTGPHLDVRVLKDGKYIDPSTWRSGLQRLKIGSSRTPLYKQQGEQWSAAFPVTSGFGARTAPTAGASTYHPAIDYGVPGGEKLYWEGPGTFKPGSGYGTILTPEGYEVRLLHTKGGKEAQIPGETLPVTSAQKQPTESGITYNLYIEQPTQQQAVTPKAMLANFIQSRMATPQKFSPKDIYAALSAAATNPSIDLADLS